jgi:hypothetical protein
MRSQCIVLFLTTALLVAAAPSERVIFLESDDVSTVMPQDSTAGGSYVLTVPIPQGLTVNRLHRAVLEFFADVSGPESEVYESESELVEVYALEGSFDGVFDFDDLRRPSPMTRNVVVGENRRVAIDITEFLRYNLVRGVEVQRLVVGFVRSGRDGVFRLLGDGFGEGKFARVTIVELPTE